MSDLGKDVLSYIFPSNREAMEYALERLTPEHFAGQGYGDQTQRTFFKLVSAFAEKYSDVVSGNQLVNVLKRNGVKDSQVLLFTETYNLYVSREVSESAFRYAVDGLIDDHNTRLTGDALATSLAIMQRGEEIDGETREGWKDASEYLQGRLAQISESVESEETPEGDMRLEVDKILSEYQERENSDAPPGMLTGIKAIDDTVGGIADGEFSIVAAYTNEGKSQFVAQLAWHAAVHQGRNVYFATTETVRNTTMRRILARHSREPQFGLPRGLNISNIKNGTLTADEKAVYFDVVRDFTGNNNYASCHIAQMPRTATLNYLNMSATRANRHNPIQFAAIDYLQLFTSLRARQSEREEYNELLRGTKVWSNTFDGGRGIPVISPWQMRQEDYKSALKSGLYTLSSLSDTSEAEKTPDLIFSLLRPAGPDSNEGIIQVLKARDAPTMGGTPVHLDYRNSYIGEALAPDVHALDVEEDLFNLGGFLNG